MIDLRSDTVTRPTNGMRAAMAAAEVGDDVYGEDPTVNALEERVAALCGHEAGLYVASGSLGNQLGLRLACPPGGELLCDDGAHVVTYELASAAVVGGISTRTWSSATGVPNAAAVAGMVRAEGFGQVPTRAVSIEQTHNRAGGTVVPLETLWAVSAAVHARGLHLHIDGARVWNACTAAGVSPAEVGAVADTMSVCLSKGLGAPVGSVLVGDAAAIAEARVWRKRLGGGMRQAGILAAAGLYALDHHVERLGEDHRRARELAALLGLAEPQTNIVLAPVGDSLAIAARAEAAGVRVSAFTPTVVRLVTHLDVDDSDVAHAAAVLAPLLGA